MAYSRVAVLTYKKLFFIRIGIVSSWVIGSTSHISEKSHRIVR